jgi:hypothetical protein
LIFYNDITAIKVGLTEAGRETISITDVISRVYEVGRVQGAQAILTHAVQIDPDQIVTIDYRW